MSSKHQIVYVGSNYQILEYLAQREDLEITVAYFQGRHSYTHYLVTLCELWGIPYHCAENSDEVWADLQHRDAAKLGICCYFEILKEDVFTHPKNGFINVHPSSLPHYKGRTPWFHLFKNNEHRSGVTIHDLTTQVDGGSILAQADFPVGFEDGYEELKLKTIETIKALFDAHLSDIIQGNTTPRPNNDGHYCKGVRSRQTFAWDDNPVQIYNLIRSQSGYGGCPVQYQGQQLGVVQAYLDHFEIETHLSPGTICAVEKDRIIVALRDGRFLRITQWLPAHLSFEVDTCLENNG